MSNASIVESKPAFYSNKTKISNKTKNNFTSFTQSNNINYNMCDVVPILGKELS